MIHRRLNPTQHLVTTEFCVQFRVAQYCYLSLSLFIHV